MRRILLSLMSVLFVSLQANAAPRIPIQCVSTAASTGSTETATFEGFFDPSKMTVNGSAFITDANGEVVLSGYATAPYTTDGATLSSTLPLTDVRYPSGPVTIQVDARVLTTGDQFAADLSGQPMICSLFRNSLLADFLPFDFFDTIHLPMIPSNNGRPQKYWESSDKTFVIYLEQIAAFPTKHGMSEARTAVSLVFAGQVTDANADLPGYMNYLLYRGAGPQKKVEAKFSDPKDVAHFTEMFGSKTGELHVFHNYGRTDPVDLTVNCSQNHTCIVRGQN